MNIIYSPEQKYFTLPVILIAEHYKNLGEPVVVICSGLTEEMFNLYGFYDTNNSDSKYLEEGVNCIFLQHNTPGAIAFFKRKIGVISENLDFFTISLMPDGLGNSMYGERFSDIAESHTAQAGILKEVFCFGFIHSTTARLYSMSYIRVLNLKGLDKYLQRVIDSEENSYTLNILSSCKSIFLIPYRPWGTKRFHGGAYDFGSPQKFANIYNDLVAHCAKTFSISLEDSLLAYRGDSRFRQEAEQVYEAINFDNKILLDSWLDERYTLEFIIYYLINRTSADVFIITLDSTTFQAVPFLLRGKQGRLIGSVGCFELQISDFGDGSKTFVNKILGKVKDFRNRYKLIEELSNASLQVEPIDRGLFYVEVK